MKGIVEGIVTLAESGEVKVETANPQEMAFAVHKGSYQQLGEVFWKLVQWVEENGYGIVGYSETVCYNDPHTTPKKNWSENASFR